MQKKRSVAVMAVAGLLVGSAAVAASAAAKDGPPPRPAWVKEDGISVDYSKLPQSIPVLDSNGQVIGTVGKEDLIRPPVSGPQPPDVGGGQGESVHQAPPAPLTLPR